MGDRARLAGLALVALAALGLRVWAAPRPLAADPLDAIVRLRVEVALAGAVAGAGFGVAAIAAQARAREAAVDASLTGPVWGALPGLFVPGPLALKALVALGGAGLVALVVDRGPPGFAQTVARGVAVAGTLVALAALGLFLGPGLTPTTALAFLHATLGGRLLTVPWAATLVGAGLVAAALVAGVRRWRQLLLERTGLDRGRSGLAVVTLASAGAVLVAGALPGLGLLAARGSRRLLGEDPRTALPAVALVGATALALLDGLAQAWAWPGELPAGVLTTALAGLLLCWTVVPRDSG